MTSMQEVSWEELLGETPPLGCRGQGGRAGLFFELGARLQAPLLQWRPRLAAPGSQADSHSGKGGRSAACLVEALEF